MIQALFITLTFVFVSSWAIADSTERSGPSSRFVNPSLVSAGEASFRLLQTLDEVHQLSLQCLEFETCDTFEDMQSCFADVTDELDELKQQSFNLAVAKGLPISSNFFATPSITMDEYQQRMDNIEQRFEEAQEPVREIVFLIQTFDAGLVLKSREARERLVNACGFEENEPGIMQTDFQSSGASDQPSRQVIDASIMGFGFSLPRD